MTRTKTPRIALNKESDDEFVDQFADNWGILEWRAGEIIVANGFTPPDTDLFDGAVVRESNSGISWIAMKNPSTGAFTKKYLTYPWQATVLTASQAVGTAAAGTYTTYGFATFDAARAVNSTAAALNGSGQLVMPIPGIYTIWLSARWTDLDTSDSQRWAQIRINSNNTRPHWNEDGQHTNNNIVTNIVTQELNTTGSPVDCRLWQNSGSTKNVGLTMTAELVSPL